MQRGNSDMAENKPRVEELAPLGDIEPHAYMLTVPPDDQLLYKMMTIENLLQSVKYTYLHLNRVDSYNGFSRADMHDGQQLPKDRLGNEKTKFEMAPEYTAAHYYDQARNRTYACCFSLENSDY